MVIKCPKCSANLSFDDLKIKENQIIKLKCIKCKYTFSFKKKVEKTIIDNNFNNYSDNNKAYFLINNEKIYLKEGENIVGRNVDININNDKYISRKHCLVILNMKNKKITNVILLDDGSCNNGKPSTNGTFYNNANNRLTKYDQIILNNNDKIRVGRTEMIFILE